MSAAADTPHLVREQEHEEPAVRAALDAIAATDAAEALDSGAATRSFDGGRDWQAFCRRVAGGAATPSCVIDFPYADTGAGGLNLQGDDRLLERMVCFHDRQRGEPEAWLVVVHVHTLLRWGDRLRLTAAERLQAVTSVNARHAAKTLRIDESDGKAYTREEFVQEYGREKGMALWAASRECFQQEHRKFHVVPKSKELVHEWKSLFEKGATREIVWNPHKADSVPPRDAGAKWIYDDVRKVLQAGDALCREATIAHNVHQSQKAMRGGACGRGEVEYEVVGVADDPELVRGNTCKTCGLRLDKCECSQAASNSGADGPINDVWKDEPDWATLPPPTSPSMPIRILYVGAINDNEVRLNLEEEVNRIEAAFKAEHGAGAWRDRVIFRHFFFADVRALIKYLLEFKPAVVHFGCHGHKSFLSLHQDELSVKKLIEIFTILSGLDAGEACRLVIANVCNSADLADALAKHVDFVIGHDKPVEDTAAIDFADGLYRPMGAGISLLQSFTLARNVKNCGMYCLRGRKDAGRFVIPKPEAETVEPMTSFNVRVTGGYQARAQPEQALEAWLVSDTPCPTFVLWGLGGSGKSTLGRTFAARLVERVSAAPVRLVFLLSAASMEQDYLGLLGVLSSDAAGSGSLALTPEKVRGQVHELLRSAGWRRKWLCVLDDLPPPAAQPMEEAGLDWLVDEFPWEHGRTVITTRAAEWAEDAELFGAAARSDGLQVGSFAEDEASSLVHGKVPLWADQCKGVRELVQYLHCYPLAVAQAAEYARVYKMAAPGEYLEELKRAGLKLAKDRRRTKKGEYPVTFPEVVQLSLDKILQSDDAHAEDAGQALRKLALVDAEAIPLDLLTAAEKKAVFLLQEHSLATVDDRGAAAMHALTQVVVREQLTERAQRPALLAALAAVLEAKMRKFDYNKPATWFVGRRYASHVAAVSERAREWGLLPTAPGGGGAGQPPPQKGAAGAPAGGAQGAGGLLGSIWWMCDDAGSFYERNGQYAQALRMYGQALDSALAVWGPGHRNVALSCGNLGGVYKAQGQYARALELLQRSLEIKIRVCGHDHLDVAKSYNNIGSVYDSQGKYDDALDYYQKSLKIKITAVGSDHLDVAASYGNIGNVFERQGKYEEALVQYEKCKEVFVAVHGHDHPEVASSYNNMAIVYKKQGRYQEALDYYQKALKIDQKVHGNDHPDVAKSYWGIGLVYKSQGLYNEALEEYEKCLKIQVDKLGHQHPDVAISHWNFAEVHNKQGKNQEALAACEAALGPLIHCHGEQHPDVADLRTLIGKIHCDQERYADAAEQFDAALAIFAKQPDSSHPAERATLQLRMAELRARQNEWDDAAQGIANALAATTDIFGAQHPAVAECHCHLAWVECKRGGDVDECQAHLRRAAETDFLWTQTSFLKKEEAFDAVRESAWFQALVDKAGSSCW